MSQKIQTDYYKVLNIPKNANPHQICSSYRQLALRYHPSLDHPNKNQAYHNFCATSEAFDVLYDSQKRKIYDEFGQAKLKEGIIEDSNLVGKYRFTTQPQEIFEKFFGSRNVYEHLLEVSNSTQQTHSIFKSQYPSQSESKLEDLCANVQCTLSELYNGCTKELVYKKKVLTSDGKNTEVVNQTKIITLKPGQCCKQPLVFPEQGNSEPGYQPSLLIFKIVEKPEKNFKRNGNNLIYTSDICLMDALDSKSITVTLLNGELIQLHFDQVISPQTCRKIEGKGMPIKESSGQCGDLEIKFNIIFPEEIEFSKKQRIIELLRQ